ncbi:hypothetical protein [Halorussus sp. MSC15.2]|nr:hypothetical protein [Halorussus sp. MSC15.2]NEU56562.1 hypothetical protein [Halorussus sp. MSC15.2]
MESADGVKVADDAARESNGGTMYGKIALDRGYSANDRPSGGGGST